VISAHAQRCQLCVLAPEDVDCPGLADGTMYIDDCASSAAGDLAHPTRGCTCGCRECALAQLAGVVEHFVLLPGCRAGCAGGYKLQISGKLHTANQQIQCTENVVVLQQPEYAIYNNGHYRFTNLDSSDFTPMPCVNFFALPFRQLRALLHVTPSPPGGSPSAALQRQLIRVDNSVLASYIKDPREMLHMDKSCSFRCLDGFVAVASLVTHLHECVAEPTSAACYGTRIPSFALQSCVLHQYTA